MKFYHKKHIIVIMSVILIFICIYMYYTYNQIYVLETNETKKIKELENIYNEQYDYNNIIHYGSVSDHNYIQADKDIDNNVNNNISNHEKDCDCIIKIPSIKLEKIVYNGSHRDQHLQNYELITATPDMNYKDGGNYIICGHASRLYGHSLNRLKEVKKGDIIHIESSGLSHSYKVYRVEYDNMNDTNKYCTQSNEQELTIISCAKYISPESYIVVKARIQL